MPPTARHLAAAAGLALLTGLLGATPAAAQIDQGTPSVSDMPNSGDSPVVLRPVPDVHGRPRQGATQQHGTDGASPGGAGGTTTSGPTGAGATMGGTAPQGSGAAPGGGNMPAQSQGSQQ